MPASELEADLEFLMRAARKVEQIREDLGKVGPVIAAQVEEAMLGQRTRLDTTYAESEAGAVRKQLKFERDLRTQIAEHVRPAAGDAPSARPDAGERAGGGGRLALALAGQPPLRPADAPGIWPDGREPVSAPSFTCRR